jgi:CcmD family protein
MSYIRTLHSKLYIRYFILLALAVAIAAAISWSAAAHAFVSHPDAAQLEAQAMPLQQEPAEPEGESELPWLFAVFFITWAVFFGYAFVMSRRQREMKREIEALKEALAARERQSLQSGPETRRP